jgi:hypothetical protein
MKVILNCLPPARTDTPSAALSILKAHLTTNGVETLVIYWNILLDGILPSFERNTDTIHFDLLPYLYLIAEEHGDDIARSRANAYVKAELPERDVLNDSSDYLGGTRRVLDKRIASELSRYSPDEPLLFGYPAGTSSGSPGWCSRVYVNASSPTQDRHRCLGSRDRAAAVMKMCGLFDYAIWGEGEYPLLELVRALDGGNAGLAAVPRLLFREGGTLRNSDTETGRFFDMNSGVFADHDDYFSCLEALGKDTSAVILPLESTRGCTWNACRFCVYSDGMRTRKRDPPALRKRSVVSSTGTTHPISPSWTMTSWPTTPSDSKACSMISYPCGNRGRSISSPR